MHPRLAAWRDRARVLATMPTVAADTPSRRALLGLLRGGNETGGGEPVAVRVRQLGRTVHLRPGSTDIDVIADDFVFRYQLPPKELGSRPLKTVWELGTNIGVGLTALAVRYPGASLLGVEPDPGNVALARRNLGDLAGRCRLVEAAVWDEDTELVVEGDQEYGLTVRPHTDGDSAALPRVRGLSLDTLLADNEPDGSIDFMLMDIEGTERRVLARNTGWAQRVAAIKVELHPETGYTAELCAADLQRLGFRTRMEPLWWGGFVHGLR